MNQGELFTRRSTNAGQVSGPSDSTLRRRLAELRKFIEAGTNDPVAVRVAYEVEHAIIWARMDTVSWPTPLASAIATADLIRADLSTPQPPAEAKP